MIRAALVAFLACGLPALSGHAFAAERRLDPTTIRHLVVGRVVAIYAPTQDFTDLRLEPDGAVRAVPADPNVDGRWSIESDELCLDINKTTDPGCMSVIKRDDDKRRLFLFTRTGEPFGEIVLSAQR